MAPILTTEIKPCATVTDARKWVAFRRDVLNRLLHVVEVRMWFERHDACKQGTITRHASTLGRLTFQFLPQLLQTRLELRSGLIAFLRVHLAGFQYDLIQVREAGGGALEQTRR